MQEPGLATPERNTTSEAAIFLSFRGCSCRSTGSTRSSTTDNSWIRSLSLSLFLLLWLLPDPTLKPTTYSLLPPPTTAAATATSTAPATAAATSTTTTTTSYYYYYHYYYYDDY